MKAIIILFAIIGLLGIIVSVTLLPFYFQFTSLKTPTELGLIVISLLSSVIVLAITIRNANKLS